MVQHYVLLSCSNDITRINSHQLNNIYVNTINTLYFLWTPYIFYYVKINKTQYLIVYSSNNVIYYIYICLYYEDIKTQFKKKKYINVFLK